MPQPPKILGIIWASPCTAVGLLIGLIAVVSGGGARRMTGFLGFCGGCLPAVLGRLPFVRGASALTLGHVVLAQTRGGLERTSGHELVHVRQYERWGVFFVPAYLLCGLVLLLRGRNPYLDNPFEVEARTESERALPRCDSLGDDNRRQSGQND